MRKKLSEYENREFSFHGKQNTDQTEIVILMC